MSVLDSNLRTLLEKAVKQARRTAEAAAKVALERLTVGSAEPGTHLGVDERQLRNRLRAHGRQLGDQRDPRGTQSISRLIHECAYEHWHRMLFARFLAENHLLMHDKEGMPVTLAECDELAREASAEKTSTDYADDRRSEEKEKNNLRKSVKSADEKPVKSADEKPVKSADKTPAQSADEKPVKSADKTPAQSADEKPVKSADDGWALAARYAARMLPQIFRPGDPVLQVGFAPEHKRALEKLVTELPVEVFTAEDSLGWVYQFWQAERKEQVNASGDKITGETLPAVTQLFTEHYMVLFLLHNTIGAWWAARQLSADDTDLHRLETEEEVRKAVSPPGYEFSYLRLIREELSAEEEKNLSTDYADGCRLNEKEITNLRKSVKSADDNSSSVKSADKRYRWKPAAGGFPGWPKSLKDFKLLDPCCGSGHFLVAAFGLLVLLRMRDEKLSAKDACDAVLRENIHGLEIDPRCTQIAAFALALAAWKFPNLSADDLSADYADERRLWEKEKNNLRKSAKSVDSLGYRPLPPMNIACSGLGVNARKEDWLALANLPAASKHAAQAGGDTRLRSGLEQLYDLFQKAPELGSLINPRQLTHGDLVTASFAEIQPLLTKALQSEKAKRNDDLNEIGVAAQGMAKAAELLGGQFTLVATNVPYLGIRKQCNILREFARSHFSDAKEDIATVFCARISQWLDETTMAVVTPQNWFYQYRYRNHRKSVLETESLQLIARLGEGGFESFQAAGAFVALSIINCSRPKDSTVIRVVDASEPRLPDEKSARLRVGEIKEVAQKSQLANPDARLSLERPNRQRLLNEFVITAQGIKTGDDPLWVRCFWEVPSLGLHWRCYQTSSETNTPYAGRFWIINWQTQGVGMVRPRIDSPVVGKIGVVASAMREISVTLYSGDLHYSLATPLVPLNPDDLTAIWAFCSSPEYNKAVREIEQNIAVTTDTLAKVPFDLARWQRVAAEKFPQGLPEPDSNDPTQWLFNGRLADSAAPLQVGVARLLGYHWPRETSADYATNSSADYADERRLEKAENENLRKSVQSADKPSSLPPLTSAEIQQLQSLNPFMDEDGIVCIPSVRGEAPAAERLRALLAAAYGKAWRPGKQDELLRYSGSSRGNEARTSSGNIKNEPPHVGCYTNLEDWLRNGFFDQHCKLFHQRPFIWQIWDGRKDGFSALVNYHKLDHKLLEKLTYTYIGDWIKKQQDAVTNEESGADDRLLKAQQLQDKLKLILEGEAPYDIFVRWKELALQPIGWNPDLNDGVRLNIRPFMEADLSAAVPAGRQGQAGVLRKRPNIKWGTDRGKNPPGSPWGEERDNDRHLTLAEKRAAQGK